MEAVSADELAELLAAAESGDYEEVAMLLGRTNRPEFNTLKLCEELNELLEKLLKSVCKSPSHKPSQKDIVEEVGDSIIRIMVWCVGQGKTEEGFDALGEAIEERLKYKAGKLLEYYKSGKYAGGV